METIEAAVLRIADKARAMTSSSSMSEPKPKCPKCGDMGCIETSGGLRECECRIQAREQARLDRLFTSAHIPARYRGKTLENFEAKYQANAHKIAVDYAKGWPKKDGESLFFVGPVGTGKSHLARAILVEMIQRHKISGLAVTVPNLMDDLRPGADEDKREEKLHTLKTIPLLVLDDLGAQKNTEWVTERIFVIINARYDELLPTIITSNIYLEDLRRIPGWDRIVDRIAEMARRVRMAGENYRLKNKTEGMK